MASTERKLILITGIPGTGKTFYAEAFAQQFGFTHYNLEDAVTLQRFCAGPVVFIENILSGTGNVVLTWGFVPNDEQIGIVNGIKAKGFTLVWFDGNRPAALRAFVTRGDVQEELFYLQMYRIENSKVVERIEPCIVNTFDANGKFKTPEEVLKEIDNL